MLNKEISKHILTVGPDYLSMGGISQVLYTYFTEIYDSPKYVTETLSAPKAIRLLYTVGAFFSLIYKLATDKQIKIVHLHTATKVSFPRSAFFSRICRLFRKKTILHIHGSNFDDYYRANSAKIKATLSKADKIVALSEIWRDFFENEVGLNNVNVIPNPFSTPKHINSGVKTDGIVTHALFLGLLGKRKGIYDLLNAIARIQGQLRGRFVLHVGGNGEVDEFRKMVDRLSLSDIVSYEGWVKDEAKENLFNKSTIYILPSYGEGLPISILEALAYGTAIISTPVGGIPEVVDSTNGILVQPGDIEGLSDAILSLVDDPKKVESMSSNSKMKINPYKTESVSGELEKMYRSMLNIG